MNRPGWWRGRPIRDDRRRALVDLTAEGRGALEDDRHRREGWLAEAIAADLSPAERTTLREALGLLERLAER